MTGWPEARLRLADYLTGRELSKITLLDVHRLIGSERLFIVGSDNDDPQCAVETVVNDALAEALADAERQFIARFETVTLEQLSVEFDARYMSSGWDAAHPVLLNQARD